MKCKKMTQTFFFVIIYVPSCLSKARKTRTDCPVGWLSGQKQRSVKPSGYALHRFESYSYQKFTPPCAGLIFVGKKRKLLCVSVGFEACNLVQTNMQTPFFPNHRFASPHIARQVHERRSTLDRPNFKNCCWEYAQLYKGVVLSL